MHGMKIKKIHYHIYQVHHLIVSQAGRLHLISASFIQYCFRFYNCAFMVCLMLNVPHLSLSQISSNNLTKITNFVAFHNAILSMAGAQSSTSCRIVFEQLEVLPVPCQYILSLTNFIINNQENFKHIHLYTLLLQGISTILLDQMPTSLFSKTYISFWHRNFQQFTMQSDSPEE